MNPFDPRTALLAKHAQHVVLVHFPIALFIAGVFFDLLAQRSAWRGLAAVAYYNLLGAALTVLPTIATGILAWRFQLEGEHLKGALLLHLVLGWSSAILIWVSWLLHRRARRAADVQRQSFSVAARLAIEFVAVLVIMATGHLGGFLSGVNAPAILVFGIQVPT